MNNTIVYKSNVQSASISFWAKDLMISNDNEIKSVKLNYTVQTIHAGKHLSVLC